MSMDVLKKEIKEKKLRNLYLFYGPEEYLKKYYLDAMEEILLKSELKQLNRVVLEGKPDAGEIIDHCETLPVFSEKKMVVVKNSGYFKQGSRGTAEENGDSEGKSKEQSKDKPKNRSKSKSGGKSKDSELADFLQHVPQHACLVFYEKEADKRLKVLDTVKKNGLVVEFGYQKPADLVRWVINKFRSRKISIDVQTASLLVENCEPGMNDIQNEINKLIQYLGDGKQVKALDIERVCVKSVKTRIFDLTDAITVKDFASALKILNDMVMMKEPLPLILFMIARQFRQILEMKLLMAEGMSTSEAASRIGATPYVAGKIARHTKVFSVDELKRAIEECLMTDEAIKTGRMDGRIAAELLITGLAK